MALASVLRLKVDSVFLVAAPGFWVSFSRQPDPTRLPMEA